MSGTAALVVACNHCRPFVAVDSKGDASVFVLMRAATPVKSRFIKVRVGFPPLVLRRAPSRQLANSNDQHRPRTLQEECALLSGGSCTAVSSFESIAEADRD